MNAQHITVHEHVRRFREFPKADAHQYHRPYGTFRQQNFQRWARTTFFMSTNHSSQKLFGVLLFLVGRNRHAQGEMPQRPDPQASLGHWHRAERRDPSPLPHLDFTPHSSHNQLLGRHARPRDSCLNRSHCRSRGAALDPPHGQGKSTTRPFDGPPCLKLMSCSKATTTFQRLQSRELGSFLSHITAASCSTTGRVVWNTGSCNWSSCTIMTAVAGSPGLDPAFSRRTRAFFFLAPQSWYP